MTDSNIENLATDITLHMPDILQQYTKGFITETNSNRWKQHVHFPFLSYFVLLFIYSTIS